MLPVAISKDDAVVDFKNSRLANGLLTRALPDRLDIGFNYHAGIR